MLRREIVLLGMIAVVVLAAVCVLVVATAYAEQGIIDLDPTTYKLCTTLDLFRFGPIEIGTGLVGKRMNVPSCVPLDESLWQSLRQHGVP